MPAPLDRGARAAGTEVALTGTGFRPVSMYDLQ